jgi:hypothetical protein
MTKLLEDAIVQARQLPVDQQDLVAEALFAHMAGHQQLQLTDEQVREIARRKKELAEGSARLATEEEMNALWKTCGL